MSKTKQRERNEVEYFKGQVRKLESENRQLKKRLKALDKRSHFYEKIIDEAAEDVTLKNICQVCAKGSILLLDLKYVKYETCDTCEYKKKIP